jgi:hypothetical protein
MFNLLGILPTGLTLPAVYFLSTRLNKSSDLMALSPDPWRGYAKDRSTAKTRSFFSLKGIETNNIIDLVFLHGHPGR